MALYRTRSVHYHTVQDARISYRTVPYRVEMKTNTSTSRGSWQKSYLPCVTVQYRTAPRAVGGGALYCTGQIAWTHIFCGGTRFQAHAQFRYHIILQVGDNILLNIG